MPQPKLRRSRRLGNEKLWVAAHPGLRVGESVEVRDSTLSGAAGSGLFAKRSFRVGDRITYVDGTIELCSVAREWARASKERVSHIRTLEVGHTVVDALKDSAPGVGGGSFANDARWDGMSYAPEHGGKNNAEFKSDSAAQTVWLCATRPIRNGEEIFVSYGAQYWRSA